MQQPGMVPSTMAPHDDREMSRTTVFVGGLPSAGPDGECCVQTLCTAHVWTLSVSQQLARLLHLE